MTEIKLNLSVVLPGSVMFSKEECLKTTQKVIEKTNGKTGKTYKKTIKVKVEDSDKMDKHSLVVTEYVNKKPVYETITFQTRKCRPAAQSLNISNDAYKAMIDKMVCPSWSKPSKWSAMSKKDRLEAHLQRIVDDLGGVSYTYQVFED